MEEQTGAAGGDFAAFLTALMTRIGPAAFNSWMSDLRLEQSNGDSVVLSTGSKFKCDMLGQRYLVAMRDAWCEAVGPIRRLDVVTRQKLSEGAAKVNALAPRDQFDARAASAPATRVNGHAVNGEAKAGEERRALTLADLLSPLDERSTFERFAIGDSNRLAYAAAREVFKPDAPNDIIYLHGPSGSGKTHLLHAIGNQWSAIRGAKDFAFLTYNNLQSGCVSGALSKSGTLGLQKDLLAQGIVLIDDIHLLATSPRTQKEIFNLVNAAIAGGLRLVIAGELPPAGLVGRKVDARLADRLAGGLCVAITPADEALRHQVLLKHLEVAGARCAIADEAIAYIARHFTQSTREALGALKQLLLNYRDSDTDVGLDEAAAALRDRLTTAGRPRAGLEELARATAKAFDITYEDLRGRAQHQRYVRARHAYVYLAREILKESFPRTAAILGRDHTTAMSSYTRATALMSRDHHFSACIARIRADLVA